LWSDHPPWGNAGFWRNCDPVVTRVRFGRRRPPQIPLIPVLVTGIQPAQVFGQERLFCL